MPSKTLLFTDVVDSTALVERLGDAAAAALWAEHDHLARELLAAHRGREIDRSDGFFLLFDDAADGARFALAYHAALAPLGLSARVGLHHAAVTLRENPPSAVACGAKPIEVEGLAKPLAARVMSLARGGQTLLSDAARQSLRAPPEGAEIHAHGHYRAKGLAEPIEIFELGAAGSAFLPPADSEKVYRVVHIDALWRPVREVRHNLAPEHDAFIGRSAELRELARRLESGARLVSVLGVGGAGKTRLVRRYGLAWLGEWPGGVYFCDLSEARSLEGICFAVASALDVPLGKDDPVVQLGHAIAGRGRCLVMLDNFEQVVQQATATLGRWLDRAAQASFVVTSRERLQLPGEEVFAVEPLALDGEAIELFEARARAQRAEFRLDDTNRTAVADIAKLLDGLPLAIELAAARIRVLSPAQIVQRLKDRFVLLAGARGAAARQATLKAAIDWSWELLSPWEQAALAQCSVFEGGFTIEAAEAVLDLSAWPAAAPAIDVVQSLVDKSLVRAWLPTSCAGLDSAESTFGMYSSVHDYATQRLRDMGVAANQRSERAHGAFFAALGTDVRLDALHGHGGVQRYRALARDLGNVVLACRRAVDRGDADSAVPCYVAALQVLEQQGPLSLAVELAASLESLRLSDRQRAAALAACATAAWRTGKLEDATALLRRALEAARSAQDLRRQADASGQLGTVCTISGKHLEALPHFEEAQRLFRAIGHRGREAWMLAWLASVNDDLGRVELAEQQYRDAITVLRETGDRVNEGRHLFNLAATLANQGRVVPAIELASGALAIHREVGNRRELALTQAGLAEMACEQGRFEDARELLQQALCNAREVGTRYYEAHILGSMGHLAKACGELDEAHVRYESALAIYQEVGSMHDIGAALDDLGELATQRRNFDDARLLLEAALDIHRRSGARRFEGSALVRLASLHLKRCEVAPVRDLLDAAEPLVRESRDSLELGRLLCARGQLALAAHDRKAANRHLGDAQGVAQRVGADDQSPLGRDLAELRQALRSP